MLREHTATLAHFWESEWAHVQLHHLPGTAETGQLDLLFREPNLPDMLSQLLQRYYLQIYSSFVFYSKVEEQDLRYESLFRSLPRAEQCSCLFGPLGAESRQLGQTPRNCVPRLLRIVLHSDSRSDLECSVP